MRSMMRKVPTSIRCSGRLSLDGPLQSDALQAAADALVQRHASLRAAFRHDNLSRPVQVIVPAVRVPWRNIDLSLLDEADREQRLTQILAEDCVERFDLAAAAARSLHPDPTWRGAASFAVHQSSHPDGRLVDAGPDSGTADALCAAGRWPDVAAGDAVPGLSGLDRRAGSRRGGCGLERGFGRARGGDAAGAARCGAGVGTPGADRAPGEPAAQQRSHAAGAGAGPDAQHLHPGRLGDAAWPADRSRRRGVWHHGCGAAAGDCRHREHGGSVHQHAAAAGEACARQACWGFAVASFRTANRG